MAGSTCSDNFTIQFAASVACKLAVEPDNNPVKVSGSSKQEFTVNFYYTIGTATAQELAHANSIFSMVPGDGSGSWPMGVTISDITWSHNKPDAGAPIDVVAPPLTALNAHANWVKFSVTVSATAHTEDFSFDATINLNIHDLS